MSETTDIIVELSKYPVSIIIIGVGDEQFEKMIRLDSDDKVLRNSKGQTAARDIVQFVRFNDYANGKLGVAGLAEEVLKEMPDQIVSYMLANKIMPKKLEWHSVDTMMIAK